jgi:hypothetical protein
MKRNLFFKEVAYKNKFCQPRFNRASQWTLYSSQLNNIDNLFQSKLDQFYQPVVEWFSDVKLTDYLQISLMGIILTLSPHTLFSDHVNFLIFALIICTIFWMQQMGGAIEINSSRLQLQFRLITVELDNRLLWIVTDDFTKPLLEMYYFWLPLDHNSAQRELSSETLSAQIPLRMIWDWIQDAAVRHRQPTAWANAWPLFISWFK